jgi:hypothetical protein
LPTFITFAINQFLWDEICIDQRSLI